MKTLFKEKLLCIMKNICIKCGGCCLSISMHNFKQHLQLCNIMYYVYITYSYYENHPGLINRLSASADIF